MNWEIVFWVWFGSFLIDIIYGGILSKGNIFWTLCSFCPVLNILLAGLVVSEILHKIMKRKVVS